MRTQAARKPKKVERVDKRPAPKRRPGVRAVPPVATDGDASAKHPSSVERKKPPRSMPVPDLEIGADELELIAAIDRFKKAHNRPFPSWSEVLHVIRQLGYRKV